MTCSLPGKGSRYVALAAALTALGAIGIAFPTAAQNAASEPVLITVTDKGCEPATLTVPAGRSIFKIKNQSRRAVEWEILKGKMVVEERENILPGFVQQLTATLEPGEYAITCGRLSNPQGKLVVAAGGSGQGSKAGLDLAAELAEYKAYVMQELGQLITQTEQFAAAVKAGDLATAQKLYAPTRRHYERIEPIAELFSDLDTAIDVRADAFEQEAADPAFMGFHRIEKALFADRTTEEMGPVAERLVADTQELKRRVAGLDIPPKNMVGGAAELIEEVAATKIGGEEERYSSTDLWDIEANLDGARKIVDLLRPQLKSRAPALLSQIDANFAKATALLARYRQQDGDFAPLDKLTDRDRNALKAPITVLAEDLSTLRGTLGLD